MTHLTPFKGCGNRRLFVVAVCAAWSLPREDKSHSGCNAGGKGLRWEAHDVEVEVQQPYEGAERLDSPIRLQPCRLAHPDSAPARSQAQLTLQMQQASICWSFSAWGREKSCYKPSTMRTWSSCA